MTCCPASAPVALAVCGDPIVGRALVLLLQGSHYDARFMPLSSSGAPESLDGMRLVLLGPTPELSAVRREALVASLVDGAVAAGIPILELVASAGRTRYGEARAGPGREAIPWPCSTEELERHIEDALCADHATYRGTGRHSLARNRDVYS